MSTMIETLKLYLQYPFVRYALIVGVLIALCSSLLGVTLVLKRFSFIGDGLSHVAFGAMAVAAVLNLSDSMLFVLPATVLCAILLLRTGQNTKIKGDAAIAMISVGALVYLKLRYGRRICWRFCCCWRGKRSCWECWYSMCGQPCHGASGNCWRC